MFSLSRSYGFFSVGRDQWSSPSFMVAEQRQNKEFLQNSDMCKYLAMAKNILISFLGVEVGVID